jgi:anti-sigma-K factor RskA
MVVQAAGPQTEGRPHMDYSRPELANRLAADYVLGTLRGPARRRMEALLPSHPSLRAAVAHWEDQLALIAPAPAGIEPSAQVWRNIQHRLFGTAAPAAPAAANALGSGAANWWQSLPLWRAWSGIATAFALAMAVLLGQTPPAQPPLIVVLQANPQAGVAFNASFVASLSADGQSLVLKPLADVPVSATQALELWAVPAQGAPRSLGLVRADAAGTSTVLRRNLLRDTAAFAVSVEPAGGSPTGAPTGPIVSLGKLAI